MLNILLLFYIVLHFEQNYNSFKCRVRLHKPYEAYREYQIAHDVAINSKLKEFKAYAK